MLTITLLLCVFTFNAIHSETIGDNNVHSINSALFGHRCQQEPTGLRQGQKRALDFVSNLVPFGWGPGGRRWTKEQRKYYQCLVQSKDSEPFDSCRGYLHASPEIPEDFPM
ncbi:hypothetical protein HDE_08594 [Halotydeus destructor]|nr:hypothetical protein HDE_08594 [Halotydeus destructor]